MFQHFLFSLFMILFKNEPVVESRVNVRYVCDFVYSFSLQKYFNFFSVFLSFLKRTCSHCVVLTMAIACAFASSMWLSFFRSSSKCHMCATTTNEQDANLFLIYTEIFLEQLNDLEFSVSFLVDDVT